MTKNTAVFTVHKVGEVTGDTWAGSFELKLILTGRERLFLDNYRKSLLVGAGDNSESAYLLAWGAAASAARIVSAPDWWKTSNNGLDFADFDVVTEVYNQISTIVDKFEVERMKKVNEAKKAVEKALDQADKEEKEEK